MLRWFGILIAIALCSTSADAQVFKPKAKKPAATEKKAKKSKKAAKKQPRSAHTKKRVSKKKSKRTRDEVASKDDDKDYVKIWDDDEVE
jgi:hypothetical protein